MRCWWLAECVPTKVWTSRRRWRRGKRKPGIRPQWNARNLAIGFRPALAPASCCHFPPPAAPNRPSRNVPAMSSSDSRDRHSSVESWPHSLSPLSHTHTQTRSKSIFTRSGNKTKARETQQQQQQMGLCTLGNLFFFRKGWMFFYNLFTWPSRITDCLRLSMGIHMCSDLMRRGPYSRDTWWPNGESYQMGGAQKFEHTHNCFWCFGFFFPCGVSFFFLNWNEKTKNLVFMQITLHVYWSFIRPPFIILSTEIDTHGKLPATRVLRAHTAY